MKSLVFLSLLLTTGLVSDPVPSSRNTLDHPTYSNLQLGSDSLKIVYDQWVDSSLKIAEYLFYQGKLDRAMGLVDTGIYMVPEKEEFKTSRAKLHIKKGKLHAFQSFTTNTGYEDGLGSLERARSLLEGSVESILRSDAFLFTGFLIYSRRFNNERGSYEKALEFYRKAHKIREEDGDTRGVAEALYYEGIIYERLDSVDTAEEYYQKALEISDRHNFYLEKSYATRHLAFLRADEGHLEQALSLFKESLKLREKVGFNIYLPFSYLSVGQVYEEMTDYEKALPYYKKALNKAEEIGAERVQVLCLLSMGSTQKQTGAVEGARQTYSRAAEISRKIGYESGIERANDGLKSLKK